MPSAECEAVDVGCCAAVSRGVSGAEGADVCMLIGELTGMGWAGEGGSAAVVQVDGLFPLLLRTLSSEVLSSVIGGVSRGADTRG